MVEEDRWPSTASSLLVRLRQESDSEAWSVFVQVYTPLIFRYCTRRGLQEADAADVTQDVLQRIVTQIRTFQYDPERGRFRGWLGTLARHAISDYIARRKKSGQGHGGDSPHPELQELAGENDPAWTQEFNAVIYESAMERVRKEYDEVAWQAFEMVWIAKKKPAEVALILGKPADWVYKTKYNALKRLREEVEFLSADLPHI